MHLYLFQSPSLSLPHLPGAINFLTSLKQNRSLVREQGLTLISQDFLLMWGKTCQEPFGY